MTEEQLYYKEITPSGFGIAIKIKKVLFSEQSKYQKIEVLESDSKLGKILTLDDLMTATEGDEYFYHEMFVHIPMLNHKCPKSVLVIGGGDGGTVREILKHDTVERVVLCEIDNMVIEVAKKYLPTLSCDLDNPKVEIVNEDAFKYIKDKKNSFDIILIDTPDPVGPGVGLFTTDFYTNVKEALKQDGIMVTQSESPVANENEIKHMYEQLKQVFPIVSSYTSPIPTYPGGCWAWAFCSETIKPLSYIDEKRAGDITKKCKIYNVDYHKARFALPTFLDDLK
ncbi:MAG: polyamine aminopropyltransferase [Candidatus Gastranaerophilaceae bacterium]